MSSICIFVFFSPGHLLAFFIIDVSFLYLWVYFFFMQFYLVAFLSHFVEVLSAHFIILITLASDFLFRLLSSGLFLFTYTCCFYLVAFYSLFVWVLSVSCFNHSVVFFFFFFSVTDPHSVLPSLLYLFMFSIYLALGCYFPLICLWCFSYCLFCRLAFKTDNKENMKAPHVLLEWLNVLCFLLSSIHSYLNLFSWRGGGKLVLSLNAVFTLYAYELLWLFFFLVHTPCALTLPATSWILVLVTQQMN